MPRPASRPALARLPVTRPGLRVGLFGGSFDPPHAGHLHVAATALRRLGLDRVWWLVTPGNPLKATGGLPAPETRMAAARRLARDPRMIVTDVETRLGTRYTIDLVRRLTRLRPGVRFVLVIGADNWATIHRWGHWQEICQTLPIAVVDRPGASLRALAAPAARRYAARRIASDAAAGLADAKAPAWVFLTGPRSSLSSTALRGGARQASPAEG
ncbi:nicotinate-nucleotide adenylyltransferase [Methylobrevis pamukkalensis]|uniref:Probable nicotinate-nucleotide adenylyltransferase n=1 Tax=Methylobrevis pamukkalensis TaxID=1439726 RepID=A0A1E3H891_9HYPH|nr:nicotinate-nucleotide adenylyltransferase [Methylobrevis pamukkalensis]ODN72540.1 putative nicotinate-nucleotide adenylyltransferase [Methylobrevis pamukkalensis]